MGRLEAEAAIEAGMIAAGWRIKHREPWPRPEYREGGESATGTMWHASKPALGTEITTRFEIPDEVLEDGRPDELARYIVDNAGAEYDQLVREGVPA